MDSLVEKQAFFAFKLCGLIYFLKSQGYLVTLGEAYRPKETAELYAKQGRGIANSLHTIRLAIDLEIFSDGRRLIDFDEWEEAGRYWEKQSEGEFRCCWGGRFKRQDVFHFSVEHGGVR